MRLGHRGQAALLMGVASLLAAVAASAHSLADPYGARGEGEAIDSVAWPSNLLAPVEDGSLPFATGYPRGGHGAAAPSLLQYAPAAPSSAPATSSTPPGSSSTPPASTPGQAQPSPPAGGASEGAGAPIPYSRSEFPGWLWDLRRGEIVAIGSFPITLLFSTIAYQLFRYASNNFSADYAPAILGGTSKVPLTQQDQINELLIAVGFSVTVAVIDFVLGKIQPPPKSEVAP